jgi:hypothetical protein
VSAPGISASAKVKKWQEGDKTIRLTFLDGKVTVKTQTGL